MKPVKMLLLMIVVVLGASLFVYGGYDDSPGAQGLGGLAALAGIGGIIRAVIKKS